MLRALNSQEPRGPVSQWQTSFHSTAGDADCLFVTNVTSRGARGVRPWCVSIVVFVFEGQSRTEYAYIYCLCPAEQEAHTPARGGEETLWDVTGGLLVLWIGSPWCQPSDDSHVDEVNFLLAKWEQILDALGCLCLFQTIFWLCTKGGDCFYCDIVSSDLWQLHSNVGRFFNFISFKCKNTNESNNITSHRFISVNTYVTWSVAKRVLQYIFQFVDADFLNYGFK